MWLGSLGVVPIHGTLPMIHPIRYSDIYLQILPMLLLLVLNGCSHRYVSVEDVDKMIKHQLPIGSEKQEIKSFIENLSIGQREIRKDTEFHKATPRSLGNRDPEKVAELGDRIDEFIGAAILNTRSDGILTFEDIIIQFYIDKNGHLIGYTVKNRGSE